MPRKLTFLSSCRNPSNSLSNQWFTKLWGFEGLFDSCPWFWRLLLTEWISESDTLPKKGDDWNVLEPHLLVLNNPEYLLVSNICTGAFSIYVVLLVWDFWGVAYSDSQAEKHYPYQEYRISPLEQESPLLFSLTPAYSAQLPQSKET